ncbi:hypothetical protein KAW80_03635 [Candidatus Babeliales bacterium]|nr:hypothetical protein [Candidatus Babeliales bacterium]
MKNTYIKILPFIFSAFLFSSDYKDAKEFIDSSINHYDFKAEGRYTHEYHPFILNRTVKSLYQLRDRFSQEGLNLQGHLIISGYEGGALPSYYTKYDEEVIDDEMATKTKVGWSMSLHNFFGLMTGYLFKDFNEFSKRWFKDEEPVFEHINPANIEIFNLGEIFQKHSFRQTLDAMKNFQFEIEEHLKKKNWKGIYSFLINYWEYLYKEGVMILGSQVAATQDILFSIDYGKYLLKSDLPILKFYCGGDITYPIEKSVTQGAGATKNAQDFVKIFTTRHLKAMDNKKTVYVFNSFVDGVGKTTMLGNVKNWMQHEDRIDKYERVDNSSSQWADVFKFDDKVYVADLPAQMSHFTYKPDGMGYVDVGTEKTEKEIKEIKDFILGNRGKILNEYDKAFDEVKNVISKEGFLASSLNDPGQPEKTYVRNLILLAKDSCYLPFKYKNEHYLCNFEKISDIRILRSLAGAASHGLKNMESEQMLFFEGIRFPIAYDTFLDDLVGKLKTNGVENVVFVDFLSMYPRSSRENIRINYLLQQMSLLDDKFLTNFSLYKSFVNASELYSDLLKPELEKVMFDSFKLEILSRYGLFKLIERCPSEKLEGLSLPDITKLLKDEINNLNNNESVKNYLDSKSKLKFICEKESLDKEFGLTKEFINVQQFSFELLKVFSDKMQAIFFSGMVGDRILNLWSNLDGIVLGPEKFMSYLGNVKSHYNMLKLSTGESLWVNYDFPIDNRQVDLLAPLFQTLRANWYAALANILFLKEEYAVPPMVVKFGQTSSSNRFYDRVYVAQKLFPEWEGKKQLPYNTFHIHGRDRIWGEFLGRPYCLDWENNGTNHGVFGFGAPRVKRKLFFGVGSIFSDIINSYQEEFGSHYVLPTSTFYEKLVKNSKYHRERERFYSQAKQNGYYNSKKVSSNTWSAKIFLGTPNMKDSARLFIKMIATLEMILKDADADIVVRKGNKEDFAAALHLLEKIVLPEFLGIFFPEPLFEDYNSVEPILSWDFFSE